VLAVRDGAGWHLDPYTNNGESFYTVIGDFDVTLTHPSSLLTPATGTSTETTSAAPHHARGGAEGADSLGAPGLSPRSAPLPARACGQRLLGQRISTSSANSMLTLAADAVTCTLAARRLPVR